MPWAWKISARLPISERLARRFHRLGEPVADLNQVAAMGLLKAIDRYESNLGSDFPSFAVPTIVGELKRHFRDHGWTVRVPRRLQELRLSVNKARTELFHQLSRVPTTADIATYLDVVEEAVVEAIVAAGAYRPTSLSTPVGTDVEETTLADRTTAAVAAGGTCRSRRRSRARRKGFTRLGRRQARRLLCHAMGAALWLALPLGECQPIGMEPPGGGP